MKLLSSIFKGLFWILWLVIGAGAYEAIAEYISPPTGAYFSFFSALLFFIFAIYYKRLGVNYVGGQVNYYGTRAIWSSVLFLVAVLIFGGLKVYVYSPTTKDLVLAIIFAIPYSYILYKTEIMGLIESKPSS